MISLKNSKEIEIMAAGGKILSEVITRTAKKAVPGNDTQSLDNFARQLIAERGGRPSFQGYQASWAKCSFPAAICVSINNEIVHGIPDSARIIKTGDIVSIDCGLEYRGYFTDAARTVFVGRPDLESEKLVAAVRRALDKGISKIKPGAWLSEVSRSIGGIIENSGLAVIRQLVGHGVGHKLHEPPQIPNFWDGGWSDLKLEPGMTLALEPMAAVGSSQIKTASDGWTVLTVDGGRAAHFEDTVAVIAGGRKVLTR